MYNKITRISCKRFLRENITVLKLEFTSLFYDPKFHYPVHNNQQLVPKLRQINPFHIPFIGVNSHKHRQRKFNFIVEIPRIATSVNVPIWPFPVSTTDFNILLPRQ